jgi:hypothetical protein
MAQFTASVILDESAKADEIRNPAKVLYDQPLSGSRLASSAGGLGRDDELRHSLLRGEVACRYSAELNRRFLKCPY